MDVTTYEPARSAAFMRSRDRYGDMSDMTFGFPLSVNGMEFQGPEGLYQALKFPNSPETQGAIAAQRSGMDAKKAAYRDHNFRPDWEEIKVQAMRYTMAVKLRQHPQRFGEALAETGDLPIVERSNRDPFWGAQPQGKHPDRHKHARQAPHGAPGHPEGKRRRRGQGRRRLHRQVPAERLSVNGQPVPAEVPAEVPAGAARKPGGRDKTNGTNSTNGKNPPVTRAPRETRAAGNRIQF